MAPDGNIKRRIALFAAAFAGGVGATLLLGIAALAASPDRHLEPSGMIFAVVLAALLGGALALVFSPAHSGARALLDSLVAVALWLGFTAATWALLMPTLDNVVGIGLLFVLPELFVCWSVLGAGLIGLVCVPSVRREATSPVGVGFVVARTVVAVGLACAALAAPRLVLPAAVEEPSGGAPPRRTQDGVAKPGTGGYDIEVRAHVLFTPNGANQTIASRPLDEGQAQFPWVFRIDPHGQLAAGINLVGTDLTWCTATTSVPAGEHDVALELRGREVRIALDRDEVARCAVDGALATSGEVLWGRVRHFKSPDDTQGFAGSLSSTFARETLRR